VSVRQAEEVLARIQELNLPINRAWGGRPAVVEGSTAPPVEIRGGIKITLLSPRRKDMDRLANSWEKSLRGAPESSDNDTEQPAEGASDTTGVEPLVYVVSAHKDERWRRELEQLLVPMLPRERVAWSANIAADDSATLLNTLGSASCW
jgi:hypothetical protein